ncbi:hypothetical protein R6Z07F_013037 [Ovis aries]
MGMLQDIQSRGKGDSVPTKCLSKLAPNVGREADGWGWCHHATLKEGVTKDPRLVAARSSPLEEYRLRSSMQQPWWTLLLVIVGLPILSLLTFVIATAVQQFLESLKPGFNDTYIKP